jgi:hypothetical protein
MFQKQRAEPLVDKVSNIGKDLLAQFHGQQTRTHRRTEFVAEAIAIALHYPLGARNLRVSHMPGEWSGQAGWCLCGLSSDATVECSGLLACGNLDSYSYD